jgi:hypothetical protein
MVNAFTGNDATEYADRFKNAFPNFKTAFLPEYASLNCSRFPIRNEQWTR